MIYLTSTNQSAITAAELKISTNCGLANGYGTATWGNRPSQKAINSDMWFVPKPLAEGWGNGNEHFTQTQMMNGVDLTDIIEQERNEAWFPVPGPL